jgi:hypothetical protein
LTIVLLFLMRSKNFLENWDFDKVLLFFRR